jgi:predicted phosphodiesterase
MQIAVISDLHLGCGDRADGFGHESGRFDAFLTFLEHNFEKIVLLGDIWDTLASPHLCRPQHALDLCRRTHSALARRLSGERYVYVHGNHDMVAGFADRAPDHLNLEIDGLRLLMLHGHQHDLLVRHAQRLTDLAVWFSGWLLRWRLGGLYRLLAHIDDWRGGISVRPERCSFQRWAVGLARQRQADVIVTGHTHKPVKHTHGDVVFLNSGTCSGGRHSFVALDTRRAVFDVHASF